MFISTEMRGLVLRPEQLAIVRDVYRRLKAEGHLSNIPEEQEAFATYVLKMYFRGMVIPEKLYELCLVGTHTRKAALRSVRKSS
jgi:hypothetical protein